MAQADGVVSNASGAAVRADINDQLAAAFTNHSGATAPATTYAYQYFVDTSANEIKIRNGANSSFISLRGTDGKVILPSGSATAPAIYFDGETNTGFYEYANDVIGLSVNGSAYGTIGRTLNNQHNAFVIGNAAFRATPINPTTANADASAAGFSVAGPISATDGGGQVHIGTTDRPLTLNKISATGNMINFNVDGSFIAAISTNGSTISYNTGSDYRLKENVVPLTGAKDRVNQLNACRFNFIKNPSQVVDGFLAHEAQTVVPEAITNEKDETFDDGSPKYQLIDQSKIVPLLTAALQEAFSEIAALTARVEALEAG
mgnify:CR=1 FL=1|tara:strand:+ start:4213 stop:5166 length:954 start_codon:yes stop_codon:yes gene_type:complete